MIKNLMSTTMLACALSLSACATFDIGPSGETAISTEAAALDAPLAGYLDRKQMDRFPPIGPLFLLIRVWTT